MAVQEQIEQLKHSIDQWNQWRREYPNLRPDLSGAQLDGLDLNRANLKYADLTWADLRKTGTSLWSGGKQNKRKDPVQMSYGGIASTGSRGSRL